MLLILPIYLFTPFSLINMGVSFQSGNAVQITVTFRTQHGLTGALRRLDYYFNIIAVKNRKVLRATRSVG